MSEPIEVDRNRTGVKAVKVEAWSDDMKIGECYYTAEHNRLAFACPGCGQLGSIRIGHPKPVERPSWDIVSGTPDDPTTLTVEPSIHCAGCCNWHGYLIRGTFISC